MLEKGYIKRGIYSCEKQPKCPSDGTWRTDVGQRGGGKNWCGSCLRAEDLERRGLFRQDNRHVFFKCRSCSKKVTVRLGCKKEWRKGTEYLSEKRLCPACIDLEDDESSL